MFIPFSAHSSLLPLLGSSIIPELYHDEIRPSDPAGTNPISGSYLPHVVAMPDNGLGFQKVLDIRFPFKVVLSGLVVDTKKGNHLKAFALENERFGYANPGVLEAVEVFEGQPMVKG